MAQIKHRQEVAERGEVFGMNEDLDLLSIEEEKN
jgi:hypothetical protein